MSQKSFGEVFQERLESIEQRAKNVGLNFTAICKEAGISRATPDRWKRHQPKTIALIDQIESVVAARERDVAAGEAAANSGD